MRTARRIATHGPALHGRSRAGLIHFFFFDFFLNPGAARIRHGNRLNEFARVGMLRILYYLLDAAGFRDRAVIEHDDILAHLIRRRQIVRYVHEGYVKFSHSLCRLARIVARSEASTIETGSSAIMSLGLSKSARAIVMRCR